MTLLAVAYLAVQYMLALRQTGVPVGARRRRGRRAVPAHRRRLRPRRRSRRSSSALQCAAAAAMLALGLRRGRARTGCRRPPSSSELHRRARRGRRRRGLADRGAGAAARRRARGAGAGRADRRDRLVPRAVDDRARRAARRRASRSSRSTRTSARTAGRRRSREDRGSGEADAAAFRANLDARRRLGPGPPRARAARRRRWTRSQGDVDLLFVDGAHRYGPARDDIVRWGARVRAGGRMLVHDSFSSVGVTLALLRDVTFSRRWRYVGRDGSLAEYVRVPGRRGRQRAAARAAAVVRAEPRAQGADRGAAAPGGAAAGAWGRSVAVLTHS